MVKAEGMHALSCYARADGSNPSAASGDSKWVEMTVYAHGSIEPDKYEIDFTFRTILIEADTEIIYQNRYLPGTETIKYVDRIEYVDREVIEYIYNSTSNGDSVDWWWIPISIISTVLITLGISELCYKFTGRRRQ